jgi:hypothetical protein
MAVRNAIGDVDCLEFFGNRLPENKDLLEQIGAWLAKKE